MTKNVGIYKIINPTSIESNQIPIYQGLNTETGRLCSIKKVSSWSDECNMTFSFDPKSRDKTLSERIENEIAVLKKLKGSGFLRCKQMLKTQNSQYYVYDHYPQLCLKEVIEFINGTKVKGQVEDKIRRVFNRGGVLQRLQIYESQKISIIIQILNLLESLNSAKIVHKNFTPSNLFLTHAPNQIDDLDIKLLAGNFYQSEQGHSSIQLNQNIKRFTLIIKSMKIMNYQNISSAKRKNFQSFVDSLLRLNQTSKTISIQQIEDQMQRLTVCQFIQAKSVSAEEGNGNCQKQKQSICSQTTSEGSISFQLPNSTQYIKQSQIDYSILKGKDTCDSKSTLTFIKTAFKVCAFAVANQEHQLKQYLIALIQNTISTITQTMPSFLQQNGQFITHNLQYLKTYNTSQSQCQEKTNNIKQAVSKQETILKLKRKLWLSYLKYKDQDILTNGYLLINFLTTFTWSDSSQINPRNLHKVLRLKAQTSKLTFQDLHIFFKGNVVKDQRKQLRKENINRKCKLREISRENDRTCKMTDLECVN